MKKLLFSLCMLAFIAITSSVFGQSQTGEYDDPKIETVNAIKTYSVTSVSGNHYTWAVYGWDGVEDFTASAYDKTAIPVINDAVTGDFTATFGITASQSIKWLKSGSYVVEVTEANGGSTGCTTTRRYGVTIIELDLLVETFDLDGTTALTSAVTRCNTNEGGIYGNDDPVDLNDAAATPVMGTMIYTYKVSLYTKKGSTTATDLIADASNPLKTAAWKFTIADNSEIPATPGSATWSVSTDAGYTYSVGNDNVITVPAGTSTVTIKVEINNIAAAVTEDYVLDFSIASATVLLENSASHDDDYQEGQESFAVDGSDGSNTNTATKITVNSVPNTGRIAVD